MKEAKGPARGERVPQALDPVCKMTVDLSLARTRGLSATHQGREYGFCSAGCRTAFLADPAKYAAR